MSKTKRRLDDLVIGLKKEHPNWGRSRLASALGVSEDRIRHAISRIRMNGGKVPEGSQASELIVGPAPADDPPTTDELASEALKILRRGPVTVSALAGALGCPVKRIKEVEANLRQRHYDVSHEGTFIALSRPKFGRLPIELVDDGGWFRLGLVSDTHLGCREERLDALHAVYDIYAKEGIKEVFLAGNPVDGYIPKINGASAIVTTPDDQALYFIDNFPRRDGITTYFITGDDHEGWWIKNGFNFGRFLHVMAEDEGRTDLKYLGHVEADVEIRTNAGAVIMKIQHPGGGSAYARSYTAQKQIEAFQGGEKPQILVQGHYHVNNYMFERNVHVISLPGFQDQTVFARKKRLRMDVGGGLIEFKLNPKDAAITRFRYELIPFFDRGYYRAFLRSDSRLIKGHLVLDGNRKGAK